jgi:type III restriction enzyme
MLSEGWDAKTVTHIMGLRAFTSQLLCEQVVGRGLRRTSYELNEETSLYDPEYVNIFGVPFTFLPHETSTGSPPVQKPKTEIKPINEKAKYEIAWPNIIRIEHTYKSDLKLNMNKVEILSLDAYSTATLAELAQSIQGKPDVTKIETIHLEKLGQEMRMQRIMFEAARDIYDIMNSSWKGNKEILLGQVIKIVEEFLKSDKIQISPPLFQKDELRRRILLTLNMNNIVRHIWESIRQENTEKLELVFDSEYPIRSTADMRPWYTARPCEYAAKSHINFCVFDGTWEAAEAFVLDHNTKVESWVKNDHLGFRIPYIFNGVFSNYYPDFIIRLTNGEMLVLETKGQEKDKDKTKRKFLSEWIQAVNEHGGFGKWNSAVSRNPADVNSIIDSLVNS